MERLNRSLGRIDELSADAFHELELEIVVRYRRDEEAQEGIAIALTRCNLAAATPVAKARVAEILAMLDHVHDPFISGSF